ncbi:MAG: hypothetical protein PWP46_1754 [Fusobacteriaceae bacterium]|jgi:hypothetical protein|nr:hypothetical protein [Fusobacteriales bacterium]MDN5304868.1 hypothetical protein [Fusobacteriaceae bacterium]
MTNELKEQILKLSKRIEDEFEIEILEELTEFFEEEEYANLLLDTKVKKIKLFGDKDELSFIGFYLGDYHITFNFEYGEDEEGPYYDVEVEILNV